MREDEIRRAIQNLPGDRFQRFATELLRRELYHGLNPTSGSHDLGEDARTESSVAFMHGDKRVSVCASKTSSWTKIKDDCQRCHDTDRQIDIIVFATAGNPRTDTQEKWRRKIEKQFGWTLECRTISWFAPVASTAQNADLVDDYLHIPPPGGDFVDAIDREFANHTDQALDQVHLKIPGIAESLPRREITRIEDQLGEGKGVLLTGDAGTGKSGIGAKLAHSARTKGKAVLYLDARHVVYVQSESQLRQHFSLNGPMRDAIRRIGLYKGCRLIIDQLDSTADSASADILAKLVSDCSKLEQVDLVVISRKSEGYEQQQLQDLVDAGLVELTSHPQSETTVTDVLAQLGIPDELHEVVEVGRNLLNLELIGTIKLGQPDFDFSTLTDEVDLWEQYLQVLVQKEKVGSNIYDAQQIIARAETLAQVGFNDSDRTFLLDHPVDHPNGRLISWGIIVCDIGCSYRFRHEKFQDYLHARHATRNNMMPAAVLNELGTHRARGVLVWMDKIYSRQNHRLHMQFFGRIFNDQE